MSDVAEANEEALAKLESLQSATTRARALELAPDAISQLEKLMKGHKLRGGDRASPHTQLRAAEAILSQAHGRPETRDGRTGQAEAGLTIVVAQLTTGETRTVVGDASQVREQLAKGEISGPQAIEIQKLGDHE